METPSSGSPIGDQTQQGTPCPSGCGFVLDPEAQQQIENTSGYFTCPRCHRTTDLLNHLPWHGPEDAGTFQVPGGNTRIGIPMADQAQIGENLVTTMGEIPGYGPITWWHGGGANAPSPLDGATSQWGIEVKTLGYDDVHHRFIPGRSSEKMDKNAQAAQMGLKGILGVLVILDYRRDVADIYVKEMPLSPWKNTKGRTIEGIAAFRKHNAMHLIKEVPFESPYKDPANPAPVAYSMESYYRSPQPQGLALPEEMPF